MDRAHLYERWDLGSTPSRAATHMKDFFVRDLVITGNTKTYIVWNNNENVPCVGEVIRLDGRVVTVAYANIIANTEEYAIRLEDERNNDQ